MSDSYEIEGVTVTPLPGGYYQLDHPSLSEPEKARGKETADQRAVEIAAAAAAVDGAIAPQPPIDQVALPASESEPTPAPVLAPASAPSEIDVLKDLVAQQTAMIEKLLARPAVTVVADPPSPTDPLAAMPRAYTGQVSDAARDAAAALGIQYVTIKLEENPDIPPTGLFISHNGNAYMISPGEPVDVPDFLLGVLDCAVMASPVIDSKTQKIAGWRNRSRFPYTRL